MGRLKLTLLQLVPILSLCLGVAALVEIHEKYQRVEAIGRATEVSQFELRRLTASLNFRLNELREELLHLYGEQLNLARALSESERERLVFFRRDHLAAFAVLVKSNNGTGWGIQKYYVRPPVNKQALELFREAPNGIREPGFWIKRVESSTFGAPWQAGGQSDGYAISFMNMDEGGKPFALVGVFRPSYVFPFCKFFSDGLGAMAVHAFVLDERGRAVCHSQARFESANFSEYALYGKIREGLSSGGAARYVNILGANVSASIKSIDPSGLVLVAEASEVSPWMSVVPYRDLAVAGGVILLVTLACGMISVRVATRMHKLAQAAPAADTPAVGELGVELNEYTKLRRELKDLESTLLDLQAMQAFVAGFQKSATELPATDDLGRALVDYLSGWNVPLVWCPASTDGKSVSCGAFSGWPEALEPFQIDLGTYKHPADLSHDPDVFMKVTTQFKRDNLVVQPVYYQNALLGLLVVADAGEKAEILPQIAQIMAFVSQARHAPEANA